MKLPYLFLWFILLIGSVDAHGNGDDGTTQFPEISSCIDLPDTKRIRCYLDLCEPGYECAESLIIAAVEDRGASYGIEVLNDLINAKEFSIRSDGHELAHVAGRQTAKHFGLSGESFLSCPSDFNYGCQHGFFEQALAKADTPATAATTICENLPSNLPPKDKFYCYHGAGHGIMMAAAYDLDEALSICGSLPSETAAEGCWQGLFMENVNGEMFGDSKEGNFLENDPLAPCNRLDEKYQWQCYINHAAYLIRLYNGSLKDAATSCLNAAEGVISACMQGIALMTTNPGWQKALAPKTKGEFIETAVELCGEFPKDYKKDCIFGAIDNLNNFDDVKVDRAVRFCSLLSEEEKADCYKRIGSGLNNLVSSQEEKEKICAKVPKGFMRDCTGIIPVKQRDELQEWIKDKGAKRYKEERTYIALELGFLSLYKIREMIISFIQQSKDLKVFQDKTKKADDKRIDEKLTRKAKQILTEGSDSHLIMGNDDFVKNLIKKFTLPSIIDSLSRVAHNKGMDCHNRAHEVGRMAYEILGDGAFKECGIRCHSGCRHGATEAFFAEKGTANLKQNLNLLCHEELNGFDTHQCFHGIGHGLMAWSNYDLPAALQSCDLLGSQSAKSSCYTGVFMENIVGGLALGEDSTRGHFTEYLNDNPQYPCNMVGEEYKAECYFLQTDRMFDLTRDFSKVAEECSKAHDSYHRQCFESMGRTVSGNQARDPERSIGVCKKIQNKTQSDHCIIGALQDQFWDESQASSAIEFCELLKSTELGDICYKQIIQRAADVLLTEESKSSFCVKIPKMHQDKCFAATPSVFENIEIQILDAGQQTTKTKIKEKTQEHDTIIKYVDGKYTPKSVTISVGQTVTWVNEDEDYFWPASNIHPTHEIYPEFDPKKPLAPSTNWSFTFTKKGVWRFHDHWNPRATGVVIVD